MRLIFSKNRPAQLDLLLRSLERHAHEEDTRILWVASRQEFFRGYRDITDAPSQEPDAFNEELRALLAEAGETVTFFCDDNIVFRDVPDDPRELLLRDERILTVSLRLGRATGPVPRGFPVWEWFDLLPMTFGYPGSIDGNTFRTADMLRLLGQSPMANPTFLETVLAMRVSALKDERPMMACYEEQSVVGVPVNRVSESSGVEYGRDFPQSAEDLNARFLDGERIDLDALDFSGVKSCHHEIEFKWMTP